MYENQTVFTKFEIERSMDNIEYSIRNILYICAF